MATFLLKSIKEYFIRKQNLSYSVLFGISCYYLYRAYQHSQWKKLIKSSKIRVIIIGCGFGGINTAILLKRIGIPFIILDKSSGIGGTWWHNRYPGCCCDIASHLYSYSFELNPNWSKPYSEAKEIQEYLAHVVNKYGLAPYIRLNTEVVHAAWNSSTSVWKVRIKDGEELEGTFLIGAGGALHHIQLPDIKGRESFSGESFHTAQWKKGYDPTGKRLAVIGTGASAIQVVPEVSKVSEQTFLFQRTPAWIAPRDYTPFSSFAKFLFRWIPFMMRLYRWKIYLNGELTFFLVFRHKGGNEKVRKYFTEYLNRCVTDEQLRRVITPTFPPGCKRLLVHDSYYASLQRPNVSVIPEPINHIQPEGVVAGGKLYPVDTIVYATGFKPSGGYHFIHGTHGRSLDAEFGDEPKAYLGLAVPDFPNFFLLLGPSTGLGHNSVVFMIECQVQYIVQCIQTVLKRKKKSIALKKESLNDYFRHLQQVLQTRVWSSPACSSWYKNESGSVIALWHGSATSFWKATWTPNFSHYIFG